MSFFEEHYPDSIALIGRERLCKDYFSNRPSMLISIKASDVDCGGQIMHGSAERWVPSCVSMWWKNCVLRPWPPFCMQARDATFSNPIFSQLGGHLLAEPSTGSLSHLKTMLPKISRRLLPAQWPNHAT